MGNIVQKLRDQKLQVSVNHYRYYWELDEQRRPIKILRQRHECPGIQYALPHGGKTVVEIYNPRNGEYIASEAICSKNEQFCKRLATRIAIGRLMPHINGIM